MADEYKTSYTYQPGGSPTDPAPAKESPSSNGEDSDLVAFSNCDILDLPDGNVLLVNKSNGKRQTVTRDVSIALIHCGEFRTLKGHAQHLVSYMPELGGDVAGVQNVLASVSNAGLMTRASDVCERINKANPSAKKIAATNVCIITCDRPAAVERLLESMLCGANLSRHKHFYLVDDSRDPGNAANNLSAVESFNLTSPRPMTYVGAEQQKQLLAGLVAASPEHENAIRFLIDRHRWSEQKSYGLARTLCLLLSVGERCIVLDDDVICSAIQSPHREEGINFDDKMREIDFYFSADAWRASTSPAADDPLTGHASCLGMGLSQALSSLGSDTLDQRDLTDSDSNLLQTLNGDAPILCTTSGSLGDPGTGGNNWLIHMGESSVTRLLNASGGLPSALVNRQYWQGRTAPTFSKRASMSQVTGLDNSHILPPYFPVFRGEDLIFAHMLDFLYPDSVSLEYDWAVPHLPLEERKGNIEGDSTKVVGTIEFAVDYFSDKKPADTAVSFSTRLEMLSQLLLEVSEHSDEGIMSIFRSELARSQVATLTTLTNKLRSPAQQSEDWAVYLQRCLAENVGALQPPTDVQEISGGPEGLDDAAVIDQIKTLAGEFGQALRAWPDIRNAAPVIVEQLNAL